MQITNIMGQKITVTDLAAAIKQAALFKQYWHKDPERGKRNAELKIYWSDVPGPSWVRC